MTTLIGQWVTDPQRTSYRTPAGLKRKRPGRLAEPFVKVALC
jgi:hypothetical protein